MEKAVISLIDSKTESPASKQKKLEVEEILAKARLAEAEAKKAEVIGQQEARQSMNDLTRSAIDAANDSPASKKLRLEYKLLEMKARLTEAENRRLELDLSRD